MPNTTLISRSTNEIWMSEIWDTFKHVSNCKKMNQKSDNFIIWHMFSWILCEGKNIVVEQWTPWYCIVRTQFNTTSQFVWNEQVNCSLPKLQKFRIYHSYEKKWNDVSRFFYQFVFSRFVKICFIMIFFSGFISGEKIYFLEIVNFFCWTNRGFCFRKKSWKNN